MTTVGTPLPPRDALRDSDADSCLVCGQTEIRQLLQRLVDARCPLVTYAQCSNSSLLTALLQVDGHALWLDTPPARAQLEQWLASPRLQFEGRLERIAVRFSCGPARLATHAGRPALMLPLPTQMLHLQRREYLRCQPSGEPHCLLPDLDGDGTFAVQVLDISGGGLALLIPTGPLQLQVGDDLSGCVLKLPGLASLAITLRVRHIAAVAQRGRSLLQVGCEYIGLPAAAQSRLLRYIMQIEREQALRRRGA